MTKSSLLTPWFSILLGDPSFGLSLGHSIMLVRVLRWRFRLLVRDLWSFDILAKFGCCFSLFFTTSLGSVWFSHRIGVCGLGSVVGLLFGPLCVISCIAFQC
ncbi:hypothetical protein RchiOBHm_Chr2g0121281 [Rosa chinensis]|uniref:Transmembrane protein n=1 Tax=Rosa chinensis TaxID=74649 RepID=A0A2P6RSI1_ROSCH|nr:hypothetical protein RchiOBHm_Chr2g0121281 [Rosa chinensis]